MHQILSCEPVNQPLLLLCCSCTAAALLLWCTTRPDPTQPDPPLQDNRIMTAISNYFNKPIPQIDWDDEDTFMDVLKKSL